MALMLNMSITNAKLYIRVSIPTYTYLEHKGQAISTQRTLTSTQIILTNGQERYQTTSAIEQFSPLPIPNKAIRSPFLIFPFAAVFDKAKGKDAGPIFPYS